MHTYIGIYINPQWAIIESSWLDKPTKSMEPAAAASPFKREGFFFGFIILLQNRVS